MKNMNLARVIMIVSVVLSLALGLYGWQQQSELSERKDELTKRAPELVKQLQDAGRKHTQLSKNRTLENLGAGQDNLRTYANKQGLADRVDIGDLEMTMSNDKNTGLPGVEDKKLRIKPQDPKKDFSRTKIANFFYKLEESSKRVRITDLEITLLDTRVKKHEVPEDKWTYECEITSRQRIE